MWSKPFTKLYLNFHNLNSKTFHSIFWLSNSIVEEVWKKNLLCTGKSLLEALILASTNPQYDKRLFIDLPVQYMKTIYKLRTCCVHKCFWMSKQKQKTICVHNMFSTCSFHVLKQSVVILWVSWCKNKSF